MIMAVIYSQSTTPPSKTQKGVLPESLPAFHLLSPANARLLRPPRHNPGSTQFFQQSLNWVSIIPSFTHHDLTTLKLSHNPRSCTSTPRNSTRPGPHSPPPHRRLFPTFNLRLLCRITSNSPLLIVSSIITIFVSLLSVITP